MGTANLMNLEDNSPKDSYSLDDENKFESRLKCCLSECKYFLDGKSKELKYCDSLIVDKLNSICSNFLKLEDSNVFKNIFSVESLIRRLNYYSNKLKEEPNHFYLSILFKLFKVAWDKYYLYDYVINLLDDYISAFNNLMDRDKDSYSNEEYVYNKIILVCIRAYFSKEIDFNSNEDFLINSLLDDEDLSEEEKRLVSIKVRLFFSADISSVDKIVFNSYKYPIEDLIIYDEVSVRRSINFCKDIYNLFKDLNFTSINERGYRVILKLVKE